MMSWWIIQVVVGGGQDAADVTTTASRAGRFEARFFHKVRWGVEVGPPETRIWVPGQ
jgi:hypothetical protein